MFDANMSHLPKGTRFFSEVEQAGNSLKALGIKKGDVILCHMLDDSYENPSVDMLINGSFKTILEDEDFTENSFIFAGYLDGKGFIDEKLRKIAMTQISSTKLNKEY